MNAPMAGDFSTNFKIYLIIWSVWGMVAIFAITSTLVIFSKSLCLTNCLTSFYVVRSYLRKEPL